MTVLHKWGDLNKPQKNYQERSQSNVHKMLTGRLFNEAIWTVELFSLSETSGWLQNDGEGMG